MERLQPALLDRLTDEEPDKTQEPVAKRVMSKARLRQAVLRDLAWLFNATRYESGDDLGGLTHARRSVINFGLPALSGRAATSLDRAKLQDDIRQAIVDFEPRILAGTLEVRVLSRASNVDHHPVTGVEIRGELWAQPVPHEPLVRTEIALETGKVEIADLLPSRG